MLPSGNSCLRPIRLCVSQLEPKISATATDVNTALLLLLLKLSNLLPNRADFNLDRMTDHGKLTHALPDMIDSIVKLKNFTERQIEFNSLFSSKLDI